MKIIMNLQAKKINNMDFEFNGEKYLCAIDQIIPDKVNNNPDITADQKKQLIQNVLIAGSGERVIKKYGGIEKVE